jgi:NAD(P)-dependent dehydrogenase (short-subunit alcohol dehydrogenase family)
MNTQTVPAAIITGGGRGIGKAIALKLASMQPVVVVGRTESDLRLACAEITAMGGTAVFCVGDVADPTTAASALSTVRAQGWSLRHLVCNAGIGKSGATDALESEAWMRIFEVNVHGCFHLVRACLPELIAQPGAAITIISSLAGVRGVAFDAAYTASKHALVGFARALAAEYRKRGPTVAALCPGFVESEMTQRTIRGVMRRQGLDEAQARQRISSRSPAGRILAAEEIADAVALLGTQQFDAARALAQQGGYPIVGSPEV